MSIRDEWQEMKKDQIAKRSLPEHYDPEKGLRKIASAEAAENFWSRAKDHEKLYEAVETKLTEQRNFVLWWDSQPKDKGGRPSKTGFRSEIGLHSDDLPVDPLTIHRWRSRLKDELKFEKSLAAAQERCRRTCEAEKGSTEQRGGSGTGENEWYTPAEYIELARSVLGAIDLDPASSKKAQETVKAAKFFTINEDGLNQQWHGRVWLNPPFAQPFITDFISKTVEEVSAGRTEAAIVLTHNYTDTSWFHLAASICNGICFTRGRVKFVSGDGDIAAPTQGQAFFYFGENLEKFADCFSSIGFVVAPIQSGGEM